MRKAVYMYHATPFENLGSVLVDGLKAHMGGVYLCETPEDALKFLAIRGITDILTVGVKKSDLNKKLLSESFEHSETFFQCRAFIYKGDIDSELLEKHTKWENPLMKGR